MERKYVAFISYRHAALDSMVAKQVHTLVEQFVIPKNMRKGEKKLGIVFRDQEELPVSSDLSADICKALDQSKYLIVICSKNTAQSPWVGREIDYFLSHHDRNNAFAVLASGEPVDVFPKALTQILHADGTVTEVEPLAVDVRADTDKGVKKKLKREITRLHAALLGCPYDALVMREQRRKRRRLAAAMAVILAVVTSFSAMMLVKNQQINQKNLELEDKNEELAQQKAAVQLRESELLTEKGMSALEKGDTQDALTNFLAALPSAQDQRPYYALAEQGLFSALDVFGKERDEYKVFDTVLEHNGPIEAYQISADGTRVVTLDGYGILTCFRVSDGSVLWTCQVSNSMYALNAELLSSPGDNKLIAYFSNTITAVDWDSGKLLWQQETPEENNLYLSPDEQHLAYMNAELNDTFDAYEYAFVFSSAKTGRVENVIRVGEADSSSDLENNFSKWDFSDVGSDTYRGCAFSSDGRYFATGYVEHADSEKRYLHYLLLDREAGTCRELCSLELTEETQFDEICRIYFADDDTALIGIRDTKGGNIAVRADKIDLQTGDILWQMETPKEEFFYHFYGSDPVLSVLRENALFLCRNDRMYAISPKTGELVPTGTLIGRAVFIEQHGELFNSLILDDGTYVLSWANDSGVYFSNAAFEVSHVLGDIAEAKLWNEGMFRVQLDGTQIQSIDTGTPAEGYGFAAVIPKDREDQLVIKRLVAFTPVLTEESLPILEETTYLSGTDVRRIGPSQIVLGSFCHTAEVGRAYCYRVIDTQTHNFTAEIPVGERIPDEYTSFLSDGSGYISTVEYGELRLHDVKTGKMTVLRPYETVPISVEEGETPRFSYGKYIYSSAVQSADGRLLTAAMSGEELTWWFDGKDPVTVPLPENMQAVVCDKTLVHRFMMAGENGYILVGTFLDDGDLLMDGFAAYHVDTDTWYQFADGVGLGEKYNVCIAQKEPWVAVCDEESNVKVYDMTTDTCLADFSLRMPVNALSQITLVADRYLAAKTTDGRVLIYDLLSGELLYNKLMEGYTGGKLGIVLDEENARLYLWDDSDYSDNGYCVDTGSWTELTAINGLFWFDTHRKEVYRSVYDYDVSGRILCACYVPTLDELIRAGRQQLG